MNESSVLQVCPRSYNTYKKSSEIPARRQASKRWKRPAISDLTELQAVAIRHPADGSHQGQEVRQLNSHRPVDPSRRDTRIRIAELLQEAYGRCERQDQEERTKLLRFLLSNCQVDGETIRPTYRKAFNLFAKGPNLKHRRR